MPKITLLAVLLLLVPMTAPTLQAQETTTSPDKFVPNIMHFPQPDAAPDEVYAVIEIPAGSMTKYELDAETGHLMVGRYQSMPVVYPANYGTLPSTLAGDNDPLDVLVYTREPVVPGALIRVRPIGVIRMIDGGEQDDKVIAVPTIKVDPTYAAINDIKDLPVIERERLVAFFLTYKQLPEGRKQVEISGIEDRAAAIAIIKASLVHYKSGADSAQ